MRTRYDRAGIALATVAIAVVTVVSATASSSSAATPAPSLKATAAVLPSRAAVLPSHAALPASAFTNSVGVDIHASYNDTPYGNQQLLLSRLTALGVSHVRDGIEVGRPDVVSALTSLSAAGIHSDLILGDPLHRYGVGTIAQEMALLTGPLAGSVDAVEGPNEWDCSGTPNWASSLLTYQKQLVVALKANAKTSALPVIAPSYCNAGDKATYGSDGVSQVANAHAYAGGNAPEATLASEVAAARAATKLGPIEITETGYHNAVSATSGQPGVPRNVAAIYDVRTLLDAFRLGATRTYLYELYDEFPDAAGTNPEAEFGLLDNAGNPKPAFTAVQSLQKLLADKAGTSAGGLNYGLTSGLPVDQLLLGRSDGSVDLVVWQPVSLYNTTTKRVLSPASTTVQLTLTAAAAVTTAHPATTGTTVATAGSAVTSLRLSVGADPVVIHITPAKATTAAATRR